MNVPNLAYLRNVPIIGPRLYEALSAIQQQASATEIQGNTNPHGQPQAPPNIQGVSVTGQNGVLHVAIQDQSAELRRGVSYYVEHADNPNFTDPQIRNLGDSRSHSEFIGNATRYVRAFSAYPSSPASDHAYHGSAATPQPVNGGGIIGGPRYLPSQGSGTGAPGQGGVGPGPIPVRTENSGFNWRDQRAQGSRGGFVQATGTLAGEGASFEGGTPGGGGTSVQPALYDTYANWTAAKYPPAQYPLNTTFTITDWNFVTYLVRSVAGVNKWVYESGVYQAALGSLPANGFNGVALGANDANLLFFENATYYHQLQWSASAWQRGPNDLEHSDTFHEFGAAPSDGGWHSCDGTSVTYLKYDGTTASRTLPNLAATAAYAKGGSSYSATLNAPTAPTFTGTPATPSGTVSQPTFTGTAITLTNAAVTATGAVTAVTSVGGSTTTVTPAGTVSQPTFTGNAAVPTGTVALPGDPIENWAVIKYYRR